MQLINIKENKNTKDFENWLNNKNIDTSKVFISPGWIDSHVHVYSKAVYHYSGPSFKNLEGVVAVIDAGSTGVNTVKNAIAESKNMPFEVFYLINLASNGLLQIDELNNPLFELKKLQQTASLNQVLGYKMRYSSQAIGHDMSTYLNILEQLHNLEKPIMFHIGHEPPKFKTLIKYIKPKDIITHTYHNKNKNVDEYIKEQPKNKFDVGFGKESFSFKKFLKLTKLGFKPNIISSDIHNGCAPNPFCSIKGILSVFYNNGYSLEEIIDMVSKNPIDIFNIKSKKVQNSLTCFEIIEQEEVVKDSYGDKMKIKKIIKPIAAWSEGKGKYYE